MLANSTIKISKRNQAGVTIPVGRAIRRLGGFSLIELIAVVTILGIIAVIVIPRITGAVSKAKEQTCFHNKMEINAAVEKYYIENGAFPNTIVDLNDPDAFPEGIPNCPVVGAPYTLNPATKRVLGHDGGGKGGGHP